MERPDYISCIKQKNLKSYGYPRVDENNILTDSIYSTFFLEMLKVNIGSDKIIDEQINLLIAEIQQNKP